ncbi:unnamed protein product [Staurois parvus]|uniref:Uncharacterized protein n=1 Tax=Staurois parvus TaxID=386267 RepID=A0ABN9AWU2_9NEOB|nr:unnamed protein product [Staurois parvus]
MGPRNAGHAAAGRHSVTVGPCTASHCSHLPCVTLRSPHNSCGFPFCHRLLADYRPPHRCRQAPNRPHRPP